MSKKHAFLSSICILAMFITVLAMEGIVPFGDKTFLMFDLKRQYVDYYAYYKTVLMGENNMFYSFSTTLGSGMMSFFAYYLMSPFLVILSLFEQSSMPLGVTVVIGLKLMLAAFIMDLFLQKNVPECGSIETLICSVSWGFCGYIFAHSMNMMWVDVVLMLPILVHCLERVINENKKAAYIFVLFVMLIVNYYIAYQVLIFIVLWTIMRVFITGCERPAASAFRVFYSTFFSGLLSAVLLIPTAVELLNSPKDITKMGGALTGSNLTVIDVLSKLPTLAYDNVEPLFGYPQLFCGVILIFMVLMYFMSSGIPKREKIGMFALLAAFMISFCSDLLNVVWHAGMEPSGHPYREAFLCVFVMILCASRAFAHLREEISFAKVIISGAIITVMLFIIRNGKYDHISARTISVNLMLIAAYTAGFLLCTVLRKEEKKYFSAVLALMLIANACDLTANAMFTFNHQFYLGQSASEYKEVISKSKQTFDSIKDMDTSFYRMETLNPRQQNDSLQFSYNGVTYYSSAGLIYSRYFCQRLGFNDDQLMTAYGHDNTATSDSILGVKYIVTDGTYPVHGAYEKVSEGDMDVYRNPYALTLAVGCDNFDVSGISDLVKNRPDMKMPHVPDVDAFALQEDIYSRILGKEVSIFNRSQVQAGEMYQTEDKYNIDYNVKAAADGELYFYLAGLLGKTQSLSVYVDGEFLTTYGNAACLQILNLGERKAGEEILVTVQGESSDADFGRAVFVTEDISALEEAYRQAQPGECMVTKESSSHITIDTRANTGVFLTVPFQRGWSVKVDGKKTDAIAIYDALTYIPLGDDKTHHHIDMTFTPVGFRLGIILNLIGLAALIRIFLDERRRDRE